MKPSYKILLTGTTSCGKTTLLEHLKRVVPPNVSFIDEIARQILSEEADRLRKADVDLNPDLQDRLFEKQIEAEIATEKHNTQVTICDRGVLDNIAHALMFGIAIKREWLDWSQSYDKVYVLNKEEIPFHQTQLQKNLGDRNWSKFRDDLDRSIRIALQECGLPYQLLSGTLEQRLKIVSDEISHHLREDRTTFEGRHLSHQERK